MQSLETSLVGGSGGFQMYVQKRQRLIIFALGIILLLQLFLVVGVAVALNDFMKLLPEAKKSLVDIQSASTILYRLCDTTFKDYC